MAIKINFDANHIPEKPTLVLATKAGEYIGVLPAYNIQMRDSLNDYSEINFEIYKKFFKEDYSLWNEIKDFKLVWAKEWNKWFEIEVSTEETENIKKTISAKSLGETELSQINLYDIQINTEEDIERDDYKPTVLYNTDKNISLLHKILEKAPHYTINHVDPTIKDIQRTFNFDNITIYDACQDVGKEINCLFVFSCYSNKSNSIIREINVYDLENNCIDCGHRGEFIDKCEKCGSTNIKYGYGDDTTIFVDFENLAKDITYSTDAGAVKNCFKLEAGDDLMTATVTNCNPDGSPYLWYISDETKEDMSVELKTKLNDYDTEYNYYQNEYVVDFSDYPSGEDIITAYNTLIDKYTPTSGEFPYKKIIEPVIGYANIMQVYYDTIDFFLYLNNSLLPAQEHETTDATTEAQKIVDGLNGKTVSVLNFDIATTSAATVSNAVLEMAKVLANSTKYQIKITNSSYSLAQWAGSFSVTNYSNEDDTATTSTVNVVIDGNYESFIKQKIDKVLSKSSDSINDIVALFKLENDVDFKNELKKYALVPLTGIHNSCQSCLDLLVEQGISEDNTSELYNNLYAMYYRRLSFIQNEMDTRNDEIIIVAGNYDNDNGIIQYGVQTMLNAEQTKIQIALNFESFLGSDLWLKFVSYRRENTYENANYLSDGLNNAELFKKALEFIETARKDIYKSSVLQHTITAKLNNLLIIKEFEPIVAYFKVGNWLRIRVDKQIYQLRLVDYEIDFENLTELTVSFSDVKTIFPNCISDLESITSQSKSLASSYDAVARQANQGEKSNTKIKSWIDNGLDVTQMKIIDSADNQNITWDEHGMLFRVYDSVTESYNDTQMKIINSTIAVTNDNWQTTKSAMGKFYYTNPISGDIEEGYGINAEVIVGKLVLGESLGIYNTTGSMTFDETGFTIKKQGTSDTVFSVDTTTGNVFVKGEIETISGNIGKLSVDENGLTVADSMFFDDTGLTIKEQSTSNTLFSVDATTGDAFIKGEIEATSGKIGKLNVNSNGLNVNGSMSFDDTGLTIKKQGTSDTLFSVNSDTGDVFVKGEIEANSGQIGDFLLSDGDFVHTEFGQVVFHLSPWNLRYFNATAQQCYCDVSSLSISFMDISNPSGETEISSWIIDRFDGVNTCGYFSLPNTKNSDLSIFLNSLTGVINCKEVDTTSDERLKNIATWNDTYVNILYSIKPICFKWKNNDYDNNVHFGVGANQLKDTLEGHGIINQGIVKKKSTTGIYSVNYSELHALEIATIQSLHKEVEELKLQLKELLNN